MCPVRSVTYVSCRSNPVVSVNAHVHHKYFRIAHSYTAHNCCSPARHIILADEQPGNNSMAENHSSFGFATSVPAYSLHHDPCPGCGPEHSLLYRPTGIQSNF